MAKNDPDWEMLRNFRYTAPKRYREICMNHLSKMLDVDVDHLAAFFSKVTVFDENRNVHEPLVTHQMVAETEYLIQQLKKNDNLRTCLLFRKPGSKVRCNQLRQYLAERRFMEIELGDFTPCDFAVVLKKILQDPAEPLLTSVLYLAYLQVQGLATKVEYCKQCCAIRILFLMLPEDNYMLMKELLLMLHEIHYLRQFNQMDAHSLAVCLAPSLICPRQFTVKEFQKNTSAAVSTLKFMIENAPDLFVIPTQLMLEIGRQMRMTRSGCTSAKVCGGKGIFPSRKTSPGSSLQMTKDKQLAECPRIFKIPCNNTKDDSIRSATLKTPSVYKTKSFVTKSSSFLYSSSVESESDCLASRTYTESRGKHKGFLSKLFPEKKPEKSNTSKLSERRKKWTWFPKLKGKEQDTLPSSTNSESEDNNTWDGHTYFPSREEAQNKTRQAMSRNVVPSYLKVQNVGKVETRLSGSEDYRTPQKNLNQEWTTPKRSFLTSSATVVRKRTFVVKNRSCGSSIKTTTILRSKPIASRRLSTYVIRDGSWTDSLPSIFDIDSDHDDVFPDEMSLLYPFESLSIDDELHV